MTVDNSTQNDCDIGRPSDTHNADAELLLRIIESTIMTRAPAGPLRLTPFCVKLRIEHF